MPGVLLLIDSTNRSHKADNVYSPDEMVCDDDTPSINSV